MFNVNLLKSAISRQAKASKLSLVLWLNEIVEFHSTFPTLGRVSKLSLLSLIGNVGFMTSEWLQAI